jgi:hypothetical protein
VVTGFHKIEGNRITVEIKLYGVESARLISGTMLEVRPDLSLYNDIDVAVREALSEAERALGARPAREQGVASPRLVLLSDQDGVEVSAAGNTLGTISDGRLELESLTDLEMEVVLSADGYHTATQRVSVSPEGDPVRLRDLVRQRRWGSEIVITTGQIMGLGYGLRYYLRPDELFVAGDDYLFVQDSLLPGSQPVVHNDFRIRVGRYVLLGPYSPFRFGVSTGLGGVLTWYTAPGLSPAFDLYLSVADLWIEWNRERWSFFYRIEGKYALGLDSGILGRRWFQSEAAGPPSTIGVMRKW